jgi:hypothetical protein
LKRFVALAWGFLAVVALCGNESALGVTCTSQGQMTAAQRSELEQSARNLGLLIQKGDLAAVKTSTLPKVASQFDGIAAGIQSAAPLMQGATLTIDQLFLLDASDLKQDQDTQFFCGVGGTGSEVTLNFQQLPPGRFALAILHATGVAQPQQMGLVLANNGGWKLAGYYVRPMFYAGHDGVWYWVKARDFVKKKQNWNAFFYYQTAQYLLTPVDFLSSSNLEKLETEQSGVAPPGLPGVRPMTLTANGQSWEITSLRTDASLGGLDLVIHYKEPAAVDPVASRQKSTELMKAMLAQHPELREGFHGLWVYTDLPEQRSYAVELPMSQIQ